MEFSEQTFSLGDTRKRKPVTPQQAPRRIRVRRGLAALGFLLLLVAGLYWNRMIRVPFGTPLPQLRVTQELVRPDVPACGFSFAVFGDCGGFPAARDALLADAAERNAAFYAGVGDFSEFANAHRYREYFAALKREIPEGMAFFHTAGNHDIDSNLFGKPRVYFKHYLGRFNYAVDAGPVRLICLDTSDLILDESERAFLKRTLRDGAAQDKRFVLFTHAPPRPEEDSGDFNGEDEIDHSMKRESSRTLAEIIAPYDVVAVLSGHIHRNFEYLWHGVPVFVTALPEDVWNPEPASYLWGRVDGGRIDFQRIVVDGPGKPGRFVE